MSDKLIVFLCALVIALPLGFVTALYQARNGAVVAIAMGDGTDWLSRLCRWLCGRK